MSRPLYLDTARLGLMTPSAQQTQHDFAQLAGDPHGLLYFREFLQAGVSAWPDSLQQRYPRLKPWRGTQGLERDLRELCGAEASTKVLLSSRSATLWDLASRGLARQCRRILTVDLLWSPYRRLLVEACRNEQSQLCVCRLRDAALQDGSDSHRLAGRIVRSYLQQRCDGLALPLVSHHGIRLPIEAIQRELHLAGASPIVSIVDGSQAVGHISVNMRSLQCDAFVAGTHKWIGSGMPLGVGLLAGHMLSDKRVQPFCTDPILRITQELCGGVPIRHGETATIAPLLAAAGALEDLRRRPLAMRQNVLARNRRLLQSLISESPGACSLAHTESTPGILLSRCRISHLSGLRSRLLQEKVIVSTYNSGLVRWSMPFLPFSDSQLESLSRVFAMKPTRLTRFHPLLSKLAHPRPTAVSTRTRVIDATRLTRVSPNSATSI